MDLKVCSKCKEGKQRTEFHKNHSKKDGLQNRCKACARDYYQENRDYINQYRQENREQRLEYFKQYRQENREQRLEYQKHYRRENRDYLKQYYRENREKFKVYSSRHRALKRDGVPGFLEGCSVEKQRLVQIYKLRDLLTEATGTKHHVDHIWPLSKGGPHWSGNLQIITAEENLRKGDSLCEETARVIQESLDEYCSSRQ